jgi:GcrA cell cycle regulator
MSVWSEERIEQMKKLAGEGMSASQIAAELGGLSRNAVLGKLHRLGVSARPRPPKPTKPTPPRAVRVAAPRPPKQEPDETAPLVMDAGPRTEAFRPRTDGQGVPILGIRSGQCRWPLGALNETATHCCGDGVSPGHPWCPTHKALAYAPASNRAPQSREANEKRRHAMLRHHNRIGRVGI